MHILELWCHRIDKICRKVHPYARIEIPVGNVGEYVAEYFNENGRRNKTIVELSINGSVQFNGISEIWGSRSPFIPNPWDPKIFSWWASTGADSSNRNPGSSNVTVSWGVSFANSNVNLSVNWSGSINASPADSPQSPIFHAFPDALSANVSCTEGVIIIFGTSLIAAVRQINHFWSTIPLLV